MKPEDLEALVLADPFMPFKIHFTDGTSANVLYPRMLILMRDRLDCRTPIKPGSWIMKESLSHTYDQIARVEMLQQNLARSA